MNGMTGSVSGKLSWPVHSARRAKGQAAQVQKCAARCAKGACPQPVTLRAPGTLQRTEHVHISSCGLCGHPADHPAEAVGVVVAPVCARRTARYVVALRGAVTSPGESMRDRGSWRQCVRGADRAPRSPLAHAAQASTATPHWRGFPWRWRRRSELLEPLERRGFEVTPPSSPRFIRRGGREQQRSSSAAAAQQRCSDHEETAATTLKAVLQGRTPVGTRAAAPRCARPSAQDVLRGADEEGHGRAPAVLRQEPQGLPAGQADPGGVRLRPHERRHAPTLGPRMGSHALRTTGRSRLSLPQQSRGVSQAALVVLPRPPRAQVEGTCHGKYGYIVAVIKVEGTSSVSAPWGVLVQHGHVGGRSGSGLSENRANLGARRASSARTARVSPPLAPASRRWCAGPTRAR